MDVRLEGRALALRLYRGVDLALGLGDHLLDARRVDAAVLNELLKRDPRDLTPHGVEARERYRLRRVVYYEVAAGERFDGTNVASLSSYYAALHLVVGEWYDGDGYLACVIGRTALDGGGNDLSGLFFGLFLVLSLDFADLGGHLMGDLGLYVGDEVGLRLVHGVAGDLLEHLELALLDELDLLLLRLGLGDLLVQGLGLFLKRVVLAVERLLLLLEPALLLGEFRAPLLDLALVFVAVFVDLLARLDQRLALFRLGGLDGLVYYPLGLLLGARDLTLRYLFAVADAKEKADDQRNYAGNAGYYPFHGFCMRLPFSSIPVIKTGRKPVPWKI